MVNESIGPELRSHFELELELLLLLSSITSTIIKWRLKYGSQKPNLQMELLPSQAVLPSALLVSIFNRKCLITIFLKEGFEVGTLLPICHTDIFQPNLPKIKGMISSYSC